MQEKKTKVAQPSKGAVVGRKYRVRCNQLTDAEREKLDEEFLKLYYADRPTEPARRH
jgi:hypothetical protein